jgi:probable F420-dependent oxidoreductase
MTDVAIGLVVPNNVPGGGEVLNWLPQRAEEWGYASIWLTDHVVGVRAMAEVYGSYWLEAVTSLSWVAARTSTIRIGTGVLVVPHRDPVLTAKMIATIDVLSGGRVDLGVGTGWSRVEFRALGMEDRYEARGRVTDEALDVMCRCWAGGQVDYDGEWFSFRHVEFEPTPAQGARVPIWVGGESKPALRRAARFADVWHPHDISPERLLEAGDALDVAAGRSVTRSIRLALGPDDVAGLPDLVERYREVGCRSVALDFRSLPVEAVTAAAEAAATVLFA